MRLYSDVMTQCGFVFEWEDKHKVPLDDMIKYALQCKSDLVYRLDFNDGTPKAVVGARNYNEAVRAVIERIGDWDEFFDAETQSWTNYDLLIKVIKESMTPWEPPYKYNTEGIQKSHTCPKCGHLFKEKKMGNF